MSYMIRYVDCDFENGTTTIKESFLGYIRMERKDAKSHADAIKYHLNEDNLDLKDCRSQCYDNANVMSGQRGGLQALMKADNPLATFVNCNNHTLNLVGVTAVSEDAVMVGFFKVVDSLYNFFARSTLRWDKLKEHISLSLKYQSETRWSSRFEAIKPLFQNISSIIGLLQNMSNDEENNNADTRSDAMLILERILTYDVLYLLEFWYTILRKIDVVQKRLQNVNMTFHEAALDLNGLKSFFEEEREQIVEECMQNGKLLCESLDVLVERRMRRVNRKIANQFLIILNVVF